MVVCVCVWRGCATRLRSWPIRCIESRDWTKSHSLRESCHWFKGKRNSLEKSVVLTAALLTAQWRPDQQEGAAQALLNLIRSVVYGHLFCFVFPLPPPDECKSSFFGSRCGLVMLNNKRKKGGGKGHFLFTSRYDTERRVKTKSSSWFLLFFFFFLPSVKLAILVIPYISWLLLTSTPQGFPHHVQFASHVKAVV